MIDDLSPWLVRLGADAGEIAFSRASAGLRAFLLYRALHDSGYGAGLTPGQRDELVALEQSLMLPEDAASRSAAVLCAVCSSLQCAASDSASSFSRAALFSAWLAFAQATYDEGDADTALGVVQRVAIDAETVDATTLAARARLLEGFIYIRGGDLASADHVLRYAEHLGRTVGEQSIVLRSRLGRANILWMRGNLPGAEAQLDRLIHAARGAAYDVLPTVLLVRGSVAHARGKYVDAVVWALRSFEASDDATQQARALTDLASFLTEFRDSSLAKTAQRALEYVTAHGPEQSGRDHAAISLLGLALDGGDVTAFRHWVAHLAPRTLRPRHTILYGLYRAKGARIFSLRDDRDRWLRMAEETASMHGFAQLAFDIDAEATAPMPEAQPNAVSGPTSSHVSHASALRAGAARVPRRVRRVAAAVNGFLDAALVG